MAHCIMILYIVVVTAIIAVLFIELYQPDNVRIERWTLKVDTNNRQNNEHCTYCAPRPLLLSQRTKRIEKLEKYRVALEVIRLKHKLADVIQYVDWEKLRNNYFLRVHSTNDNAHRKLKKRPPRLRDQRRKRNSPQARTRSDTSFLAGNSPFEILEHAIMEAVTAEASANHSPSKDVSEHLNSNSKKNASHVSDQDEFSISDQTQHLDENAMGQSIDKKDKKTDEGRQGDEASFNGKPIPVYTYEKGNCPDPGDVAKVPCAPDDLEKICDKYDDAGSLRKCLEACKPSFCCIHDAPPESNEFSPSCNKDVNCAQYAYCYIVWWKLHDTVGPASSLKMEQNDDFFDVEASEIESDQTNSDFFREMLFHHFDNSSEIIRLGTVVTSTGAEFNSELIFLNKTYWNTSI